MVFASAEEASEGAKPVIAKTGTKSATASRAEYRERMMKRIALYLRKRRAGREKKVLEAWSGERPEASRLAAQMRSITSVQKKTNVNS